jgi:LacI family transcriptional regulator
VAVTIMQIAERLQLSHSTVSRVLNNKPNAFIADETRRRVQTAARELGYRPNLAARSLRDARSNLIAIFASPYSGVWSGGAIEISTALADVLHERQLHLFYALVGDDGSEQKAMPVWRFDGAVLMQRPPEATVEHLHQLNLPFVAVNEWVPGAVCVLADDTNGIHQAMDHLWELGHRRIAYAGQSSWHFVEHYSVQERRQAYVTYLTERGEAPVAGYEFVPTGQETGEMAFRDPDIRLSWLRRAVLEDGVTAVVCYDHLVVMEVLAAAQKLMLRVPQDMSLICFNDDIVTSKLNPPITVVAPQMEMMGHRAGELLLARMDAGETAFPPEGSPHSIPVRIPERLVVRESTAPASR